jgi:hypothetical protein
VAQYGNKWKERFETKHSRVLVKDRDKDHIEKRHCDAKKIMDEATESVNDTT